MINFTPHIRYFLYFLVYFGLTFVELDLALLLTCADWIRSWAMSNFDRFALSKLSKCNFADIFIFYVFLDIMMQCITLIFLFSKFFVHFRVSHAIKLTKRSPSMA